MPLRSPYDYTNRPADQIILLLQPLSMPEAKGAGEVPTRKFRVGEGVPESYAHILAPAENPKLACAPWEMIDCGWCPLTSGGTVQVDIDPPPGHVYLMEGLRIITDQCRNEEVLMEARLDGMLLTTERSPLSTVPWHRGPYPVEWGVSRSGGPGVTMTFRHTGEEGPTKVPAILYFVTVGRTFRELPDGGRVPLDGHM